MFKAQTHSDDKLGWQTRILGLEDLECCPGGLLAVATGDAKTWPFGTGGDQRPELMLLVAMPDDIY